MRRRKRASARVETGPLMAGELEIRADQFQAFARGGSVDLTRREFEVLQLLAQAEGKVLQREEIYQAVWGYAMAHGDRSVDVFIRKVRQKLERASPDWHYIHTHFGVGYRFDPERPRRQRGEPSAAPAARARARERAELAMIRARPRLRRRRGAGCPRAAAAVGRSTPGGPPPRRRARHPAARTRDRQRRRAGEAVGVGGDHGHQPGEHEAPGRLPCLVAVTAAERERVHLRQRAGLELAAQPGEAAERRVGAALGVRQEHPEAALAQLSGGRVEGRADRLEGSLHQQPACSGRALGEAARAGAGRAGPTM